jgi:hypothetical protein
LYCGRFVAGRECEHVRERDSGCWVSGNRDTVGTGALWRQEHCGDRGTVKTGTLWRQGHREDRDTVETGAR